jgi:hypothetical protein
LEHVMRDRKFQLLGLTAATVCSLPAVWRVRVDVVLISR